MARKEHLYARVRLCTIAAETFDTGNPRTIAREINDRAVYYKLSLQPQEVRNALRYSADAMPTRRIALGVIA